MPISSPPSSQRPAGSDPIAAALRNPLGDPAIARAVAARMAALPADATALQKHVLFFDRDQDGVISLSDTYHGSRALGFGRLVSGLLAVSINAALGWVTASPPRPTLRIRVDRIHRGKHGSDTDIYDQRGRFVDAKLEEIFRRFDRDHDGALSLHELWLRARYDRDVYDVAGQVASLAEFGLVYVIAAVDGKVSREAILASYDASLFYAVEEIRRRYGARSLRARLRDWFPRLAWDRKAR